MNKNRTHLTTKNSLWYVNSAPAETVTNSTNTILHISPFCSQFLVPSLKLFLLVCVVNWSARAPLF